MIKLLENTPFGFVLEIAGETPYRLSEAATLVINGKIWEQYSGERVVSIFGLKPATTYEILLETKEGQIAGLEVTTQTPTYVVDVRDYNATGDGIADDTAAINAALYAAPKGAVVILRKGVYRVNQVLLRSQVDLYLEAGAELRQSTKRADLAVLKGYRKDYHHTEAAVGASWEGSPLDSYGSLIFGYEVEEVRIYGAGCLNGSGAEGGWWENPKVKNVAYRPRNLFINRCRHITLCGLVSRNSASWNIHPYYSNHLKFYGLKLASEQTSPNTDGLNPESCYDVEIVGCRFDVGDDCIAIKSGKYFMSQAFYQPCEKIRIRNCFMGDGHGGVAIGSEISCGVIDLVVENCLMVGTDRGIRIKTRRGRGDKSVLDRISFKNIVMEGVRHGLAVNMFYCCDPDGRSDYVGSKAMTPRDELTPAVRNVLIQGLRATGLRGCGIFMYGLPESPITDVTITGNSFAFADVREDGEPEMLTDFEIIPKLGIFIKNATSLKMADNDFKGDYVAIIEEEEHGRN